jgi:HK97 family phage prohead protease
LRSIANRAGKVRCYAPRHDTEWGSSDVHESGDGLLGEFVVNAGDPGDLLLEDCRNGYLCALSCGFSPVEAGRGDDGVREVREAKLVEVSLVGVPAYEGAAMLSVRAAAPIVPTFPPRPDVNLQPIPTLGYRPRN